MANFNKILPLVLNHEGGYANVKGDKGKMTYKGISRPNNQNWKGWLIIDEILRLRKISRNESIISPALDQLVKEQYYNKYWIKILGDDINNNQKALLIFDFAVNSGIGGATRQIQIMLNDHFNENLSVDGGFGKLTLSAINKAPTDKFVKHLQERRKAFFYGLSKKPNQKQFFHGWMNRIENLSKDLLHLSKKKELLCSVSPLL